MFMSDVDMPRPRPMAVLDDGPARLLWCMRRLALMAPLGSARCQWVHVVLQRDYGDAGLGIEHLLRCLLVGIARCTTRPLAIGIPGCAIVTPDEDSMLALVAVPSRTALATLVGPAAGRLLPLCEALHDLIKGKRSRSS